MFGKTLFRSAVAVFAALLSACAAQAQTTMETVSVGNLGNPPDTQYDANGVGGVNYQYRIGMYEVTAGQYAEFLNDVAATDPYGLYNEQMDFSPYGSQITRHGTSGSYTYDFSGAPSGTAADWESRPVKWVSWYDVAMFCNWMTSGDIHQGAYDTSVNAGWGDSDASNYTGITSHDSAAMDALVSAYGTVYVIPTQDEWYKAAYHKNDLDPGSSLDYFDWPTSSDTQPGYVNDEGNLSGTGDPFVEGGADPGNYATHNGDGSTYGIGPDYFYTKAGEWENSSSPYGTFDQGGNVFEWNETLLSGSERGFRGGWIGGTDLGFYMHRSVCLDIEPTYEGIEIGFRVASIPEPGSAALLVCGLSAAGLIWWRRGK